MYGFRYRHHLHYQRRTTYPNLFITLFIPRQDLCLFLYDLLLVQPPWYLLLFPSSLLHLYRSISFTKNSSSFYIRFISFIFKVFGFNVIIGSGLTSLMVCNLYCCPSVAKTRTASNIAKWLPIHTLLPPPNGK